MKLLAPALCSVRIDLVERLWAKSTQSNAIGESNVGVFKTWRTEGRGEDCNLSKTMCSTLQASAKCGHINDCARGTLEALILRGLCQSDGILTDFGRTVAIALLPLPQQCEALNLPFEERTCSWIGRPEQAAIHTLKQKPRWAYADEGGTLHAVIHALVLPRVYSVASRTWNRDDDYDRARSWLYSHYAAYMQFLDTEPGLVAGMLDDIRAPDEQAFVQSWKRLTKWNSCMSTHPVTYVSAGDALAVLRAVGASTLVAIASRVFSEPYAYFRGWPDLMMLDAEGHLRFVEVKTVDRLHFGQIVTMCDMRAAAALDMRVVRLRGPPKDEVSIRQ